MSCVVSNSLFLLACLHAAPFQTQRPTKVMEEKNLKPIFVFFVLFFVDSSSVYNAFIVLPRRSLVISIFIVFFLFYVLSPS